MRIPITKPVFGPEEMRAVQLPLETGWVVQGPFVKQFEEKFSAFTGVRFSAATSSCASPRPPVRARRHCMLLWQR